MSFKHNSCNFLIISHICSPCASKPASLARNNSGTIDYWGCFIWSSMPKSKKWWASQCYRIGTVWYGFGTVFLVAYHEFYVVQLRAGTNWYGFGTVFFLFVLQFWCIDFHVFEITLWILCESLKFEFMSTLSATFLLSQLIFNYLWCGTVQPNHTLNHLYGLQANPNQPNPFQWPQKVQTASNPFCFRPGYSSQQLFFTSIPIWFQHIAFK